MLYMHIAYTLLVRRRAEDSGVHKFESDAEGSRLGGQRFCPNWKVQTLPNVTSDPGLQIEGCLVDYVFVSVLPFWSTWWPSTASQNTGIQANQKGELK